MRLTEEDRLDFQRLYPNLRQLPSADGSRIYEGEFAFAASSEPWGEIEDSYELRIVIPPDSVSLPQVWDVGGRVARVDPTHINPGPQGPRTGSLCLGSNLSLRLAAGLPLTLVGFFAKCVVPYLYAISLRERGTPGFVFGELAHGEDGLVQDYEQIFGVTGKARVLEALRLCALRRRIANRAPCPCGCGRRLGRCPVHHRVNAIRALAPRSHFLSLVNGRRLFQPAGR